MSHVIIPQKKSPNTLSTIRYSEIFYSMQGEGLFTGQPTVWLRLFGCNLNCDGFGQDSPTKHNTHDLPYKNLDIEQYNYLEELPVFEKGCDSSYSWMKKYRHLNRTGTVSEVAQKLLTARPNNTWYNTHLCFTGGEPLLRPNQKQVMDLLSCLEVNNQLPSHITFETNGTQQLQPVFLSFLDRLCTDNNVSILWSLSPKLYTVSGEFPDKAIKPTNLSQYLSIPNSDFTLKFVVRDDPDTWDELENTLYKYKAEVNMNPTNGFGKIWIMPVGATKESQSDISTIADKALSLGYNISIRAHCYIWGNTIGV